MQYDYKTRELGQVSQQKTMLNAPLQSRHTALALLLISAVLVGGCAGDMADLEDYANEVKARKGAPIDPIPEIKPFERFEYPEHTVDPFDTKLVATAPPVPTGAAASKIEIDLNRPREFLESFPLDTLRLVGTLEQGGTLWALIRTADGTIQRVTLGNYMGQNFGKIIRIDDSEVVLREIVPDGFGGYQEKRTSVALSE